MQNTGGVYIKVGVDTSAAFKALRQLQDEATKTANAINKIQMGSKGSTGMKTQARDTEAAAKATQNYTQKKYAALTAEQRAYMATQRGTAAKRRQLIELQRAGGTLTRQQQAWLKATQAMERYRRTAERTNRTTKRTAATSGGLTTSLYRFSQSFINLRYQNPLGVVAGLIQGFKALGGGATLAAGGLAAAGAALAVVAAASIGAAAAIGAVTYALAKTGITAASSLERTRISYEALLGSATRARVEVRELQNLAKDSIVPTESLLEANRLLLAYGVTADGTRRQLVRFFSDFAAATGLPASRLNDLAYALGQVESQGKANAIDLRQLANAGLNLAAVYEEIAKQQGISAEEAQNLVTEGKLTSDVLYPAILKVGDAYKEAGDKARQSFSGIAANLGDILQVQAGLAFENTLQKLVPILQAIEDFIGRLEPMWRNVGQAVSNAIDYISEAVTGMLGNVGEEGNDLVYFLNYTLPTAINEVAYYVAILVKTIRILWLSAELVFNNMNVAFQSIKMVLMGLIATVAQGIADLLGPLGGWAQEVADWAAAAAVDASEEVVGAVNNATRIVKNLETEFTRPITKRATIIIDVQAAKTYTPYGGVGAGRGGGQIPAQANDPQPDWYLDMIAGIERDATAAANAAASGGGGGGGGGAGAQSTRFRDRLRALIETIKEAYSALIDLRALLRKPFGEPSQVQKAFKSGSIDTVIGMFDRLKTALGQIYGPLMDASIVGKKAAKKARREYRAEIKALRKDTKQIIELIRENEKLERRRTRLYERERDSITARYLALTNEQQAVVDKATSAYEKANNKLEALQSERDEFLSSLADGSRSFVNALELSEETVEKYTRLDSAGSFMVTEETKTKSLRDTLRERLKALRDWWQQIKTLRNRGLDEGLLKELISAGPEGSQAAVNDLANSNDAVLKEVNNLQAGLRGQIAAMSDYSDDAWYRASITAQEVVANNLSSAVTEAEDQLKRLEDARDKALSDLALSYENYSDRLGQKIRENERTANKLANGIQKQFEKIRDGSVGTGIKLAQGLIDGMNGKIPNVESAAKRLGDAITKALKKALKIKSPSKVGEYVGRMVAQGLENGMNKRTRSVGRASVGLAAGALNLPEITASGASVGGDTVVRVFIGDRELTDIVSTEIERNDEASLNRVLAGRRY